MQAGAIAGAVKEDDGLRRAKSGINPAPGTFSLRRASDISQAVYLFSSEIWASSN